MKGGVLYMCYECGCGNNHTVMSDDSITTNTFVKAAAGSNISVRQAKINTYNLLQKELAEGSIEETVAVDE